jgi:hypothetical protein
MKSFTLGVLVGIAVAMSGYKPYQIEMEYRDNIATGLDAQTHADCVRGVDVLEAELRRQ